MSYHVPGSPRTARVHVKVPAGFFGTWSFRITWPGVRDLTNTARVYCGDDGRLKFKWAQNQGAGVVKALVYAADQAVADLGGKKRICGKD